MTPTLIILAILYLVPSFVAAHRKVKHGGAICALNILLGWTFIGWAVALVLALRDND